jgi:nitrite reductase/ring-hydroxylating ferredoxin subunit
MSDVDASCVERCPVARGRFLRATALAALAGIVGADLLPAAASAQSASEISPTHTQGKTLTYGLPARDGAYIDSDNGLVIVRVKNAVYALSLTCPHRAVTTLDWNSSAQEFHCPKHGADFQADGELIDGRPDRSMDRFAVRRSGTNLLVDAGQPLQQDTARVPWTRAVVLVA